MAIESVSLPDYSRDHVEWEVDFAFPRFTYEDGSGVTLARIQRVELD